MSASSVVLLICLGIAIALWCFPRMSVQMSEVLEEQRGREGVRSGLPKVFLRYSGPLVKIAAFLQFTAACSMLAAAAWYHSAAIGASAAISTLFSGSVKTYV